MNLAAAAPAPAPTGAEGENDVRNGQSSRPVVPSLEAGRYVFRAADLELEVDPSTGGRITRFSLSGTNVLTGPDVVAHGDGSTPDMYGSTFWTSPQATWGWPPETALDNAALPATLDGAVLRLDSQPGATTGYRVRKQFSFDPVRNRVSLEYVLSNQSGTLAAAPWEVSRVPKEGLVFFAAASAATSASTLPAQLIEGVSWVDVKQAPPMDSKLFQDGAEGWLAYVYRDLVFIKLFDDVPAAQQAPGEAEIEVFVSGNYEYVEIEQQGPYALLPIGGSSSWTVGWLLRKLPDGMSATLGNAALVAWVRDQVASAR
jgi:hypothetical protein